MFVTFKTRLVCSKPWNEMKHRKPLYVCIIYVFFECPQMSVFTHSLQFQASEFELIFWHMPQLKADGINWWLLKVKFCILTKTIDIRKYGNKVWKKIASQTCEGYPAWCWHCKLNWTYNPKDPNEFLIFNEHPLEMVHF